MATIALQDLTKVYPGGAVAVDKLNLSIESGEFMVLLGPSGCGKTTVLRMIAGLEEPTSGHVRIRGLISDATPTRERNVAMVFQDYALYPHLDVSENIAFPLRIQQTPDDVVNERINEVADALGLGPLLHQLPARLSGGQRQRVAMARAIVRRPLVFLLDEPLSNVDASLRAELRSEVATLVRNLNVTTVYVTHDQTEALGMADRIAVLRRGALEQVGTPEHVYNDPAKLFVAAFLGSPRINLLQGALYLRLSEEAVIDLGGQSISLPWSDPRARFLVDYDAARISVGIRPDALVPLPPSVAERRTDVLQGVVRYVEYNGYESLVHVDTGSAPVATVTTQLELPDDGERAVASLTQPAPESQRGLRQSLGRLIPRARRGAHASTGGGWQPDPIMPTTTSWSGLRGDTVLRMSTSDPPQPGSRITLGIDLDRLLLFDRGGRRIRFPVDDRGQPAMRML